MTNSRLHLLRRICAAGVTTLAKLGCDPHDADVSALLSLDYVVLQDGFMLYATDKGFAFVAGVDFAKQSIRIGVPL